MIDRYIDIKLKLPIDIYSNYTLMQLLPYIHKHSIQTRNIYIYIYIYIDRYSIHHGGSYDF